MNRMIGFSLMVITSFATVACGGDGAVDRLPAEDPSVRAAVSEAEALAIAEEALAGLNDGDYDAFTRAWSSSMREGISEDAFLEFRDATLEDNGRFESVLDMSLSKARTDGYVRYAFRCAFEKKVMLLAHIYAEDGREVVGSFLQTEEE